MSLPPDARHVMTLQCGYCHASMSDDHRCELHEMLRVSLTKIRDYATGPIESWKSPETMRDSIYAAADEALGWIAAAVQERAEGSTEG